MDYKVCRRRLDLMMRTRGPIYYYYYYYYY